MAALNQPNCCVIILILFSFITFGNTLQCYSCSSGPDGICDDQFSFNAHRTVPVTSCENSPHIDMPGAGPNTHCGKTKKSDRRIHVNNHDYVFRGCVPENYCRLVKNHVSECEICDEERCNSSAVLLPSCIFVVLSLLMKLLFY